MKKIIGLVMMLCWVSFITSCNKTTSYTDMLKAEKKAIERLMDSNGFVVLSDYPRMECLKRMNFTN